MEFSEEIMVAMINAARDITVAKINAKGCKFDGYTQPRNWFKECLNEVSKGVDDLDKKAKVRD